MVDKIIQAGKDNWALILIITALTGGTTALTGMVPSTGAGQLAMQVAEHSETLEKHDLAIVRIDSKLDQILHNQELDALATRYKTRDRWTATMQKDFQSEWIECIRELHPDFVGSKAPNINEIQHRYPEGRETL